jgi:hypothetical protein
MEQLEQEKSRSQKMQEAGFTRRPNGWHKDDYEQDPVVYPEGDVVGPCICGSWPGGKCLKCPRI